MGMNGNHMAEMAFFMGFFRNPQNYFKNLYKSAANNREGLAIVNTHTVWQKGI